MKTKFLLALSLSLSMSAFAQTNPSGIKVEPMAQTPTFRVNVVSRNVQAVNYKHRGGATKVDFKGTDLMSKASGEAKVESKQGYIEIEVEFDELSKATGYGNEYLTYVLWAITPEGRAVNLGELLLNGNRGKLNVTTDLQAFALLVTAEPYYAVREPSNVVVLENVIRTDTAGATQPLNAKHDFIERGGYLPTGYNFDPVVLNANLPLEFFEARNALRIAQAQGAERYAGDSYTRAVKLMNQADAYAVAKNVQKKPLIAVAREAVQVAEDARAIAVKRIAEERQANALQGAADAEARSRADANDANRQKEAAQSDAARAQSDAARAQADLASSQASSADAIAAAKADAERSRLAALQAQADGQQAQLAAQAAALKAQQDTQAAALKAQQDSDAEKAAMRTKLSEQLNTILQTRDTARGIIVNMSGVLFDTGKFSLKPGAREKLSKVAGILVSYPGLNIEVGGYTDSVGSDEMNQELSENRASSVRDYLVQQGVATASVTAKGFGETLPVATNDNSTGRQQNRRVELLVSGEAIGRTTTTTTTTTTGSLR
ncbi:MAG: OmpA family protein [Terriglobales bacterium]